MTEQFGEAAPGDVERELVDLCTLDQIIIVDNRPPDKYQSRVIARFSRNKD